MTHTHSAITLSAEQVFLSVQSWQVKEIKKSVYKAESKKAKFINHKDVTNWLNSWGSKKKQKSP